MSTAPIDSGGHNGGINRFLFHFNYGQRNNSVGLTNSSTNPPTTPTAETPAAVPPEGNRSAWIGLFYRFDRVLSGSLLHLLYRVIDMTLLFVGLTSTNPTCHVSNHLAATSICLLIFYFIDLIIIFLLSVRNMSSRYKRLSEQEKMERYQRAVLLRGFFNALRIIPICVGTGYSFSSTLSSTNDCELMRFCLGVVCLSTWLAILIPTAKPESPTRRSIIIDCFFLFFVLLINCTYIGTVAAAMTDVQHSTCIYNSTEDFYLGAPLKSFAFVGIILFGCTTAIHIIHVIINQLCFRYRRGREFYTYYHAFHYLLSYFAAIAFIYYFSVGALFVFQPRSGQSCRTHAPDLYRVLLIWEWIRILAPLIMIPLIIGLCCLGVCLGVALSYCLPASITVPLMESIQVRIYAHEIIS